jgi:hypothetical protein
VDILATLDSGNGDSFSKRNISLNIMGSQPFEARATLAVRNTTEFATYNPKIGIVVSGSEAPGVFRLPSCIASQLPTINPSTRQSTPALLTVTGSSGSISGIGVRVLDTL